MEFLITSKGWVERFGAQSIRRAFDANVFDHRNATKSFEGPRFTVLRRCNEGLHDDGALFDGFVFNKALHHAAYNPPSKTSITSMRRNSEELSGAFVMGEWGSQWFEITPDILGQYHLFFSKDDNGFAVSNNPNVLEALTGSKRCEEHAAVTMIYLSAFQGQRASSKVEPLPARFGIRYTPSRELEIFEIASRASLYLREGSYADLLQEAADTIRDNCAMIADFSRHFRVYTVVDLSGGVDSRLTASGFIGSRRKNDVMFCNVSSLREGNQFSADRVASEAIIDRFRLPTGAGIGGSEHDTSTQNSELPFSVAAKIAYGTGHYFAAITSAHGDYGELALTNFARVGGYCGEHARAPGANFGPQVIGKAGPAGFTEAFIAFLMRDHAHGVAYLATPDAVDHFRNLALAYYSDLLHDLPVKLLNTATYVENRSRCHFGMRMQNANRSSVSLTPLASPKTLALHQHLTYGEIFNSKISHDLMVAIAGNELARMPFADDFWRSNVIPDGAGYDRTRVVRAGDMPDTNHSVDPAVIPRQEGAHRVEAFQRWRTKHRLPDRQSSILRFVNEIAPEETWHAIDRDKFTALVEAGDEALSKTGFGSFRLTSAMLFQVGQDQTQAIAKTYDPRPILNAANAAKRHRAA